MDEPLGQAEAAADGADAAEKNPRWSVRKLLRAARVGTLATQRDGQPFAGLVSPATEAGLVPLLLLSELSEHTRQLRRDPRCALIVTAERALPLGRADPNPQTIARVTLTATATVDDSAAARARYLAVHPYAAFYAGFGDFHLWRLAPQEAFFVGGFARARRLRWDDIAPATEAVARLAEAAPGIMAHCNSDHADAVAVIAGAAGPADDAEVCGRRWRMVGVDTEGCDLTPGGGAEAQDAQGEPGPVRRVAWPRPVEDADGVRRALILLARAARAAGEPGLAGNGADSHGGMS